MTKKIFLASEIVSGKESPNDRSVTLCFGHFNAIHPGHIRYFRSASKYGGDLVVAVEGDLQLVSGALGQMFSQDDRAQAVAALDMVDRVVILDNEPLQRLIQKLRPSTFALGREFERESPLQIASAIEEVEKQGGKVVYDAGETLYFSASALHSRPVDNERERWKAFSIVQAAEQLELGKILEAISTESPPNILVIGDTIVDRYIACDALGMSNEAPVVVVKEIEQEKYLGGAAIVSAHISALGAKSTYISVLGEDELSSYVRTELDRHGVNARLFEDNTRPTTFKTRYLVGSQKLFRVSRLKEHSISSEIEEEIITLLEERAPHLDAILVSDFVYGVITKRIVEVLQILSKRYHLQLFGDIQCSSQIGSVTKFHEFDLLCPTEREARIALANHNDGVEYVATSLLEATKAKNLILKLGEDGFIAYDGRARGVIPHRQYFPALTVSPIDVTGAGDSLIAAMAVGLAQGLSVMEASCLACCVAAVAVQTVGNQPVGLDDVHQLIENRIRHGYEI